MESAHIIHQKDRNYNDDFISKDKIKLLFGKMDILHHAELERRRFLGS